MPRKVTAWACAFRCGHRVSTKEANIYRHEATCWLNPERRACKTCKHNNVVYPWYGDGEHDIRVRHCDIGKFDVPDDGKDRHGDVRWNCPFWEAGT